MARSTLVPRPYLIQKYISESYDWPGAFAEFIDNAFGEHKGEAQEIRISIGKKEIRISDDGQGLDDINRIFQLANTSAGVEDRSLSTYGVGSTIMAIWMGARLEVHTVRAGMYHRDHVNWLVCLKKGQWKSAYRKKGRRVGAGTTLPRELAQARKGTLIVVSGIHKGRKSLRLPHLLRELGMIFGPGLRAGNRILVRDARKRPDAGWTEVVPYEAPNLTDVRPVAGSIGGKPYQGKFGLMNPYRARANGLFVGFTHRTIVVKRRLGEESLPALLYGQIDLGPEWKRNLSPNKSDITREWESLAADIRRQIHDIWKDATDFQNELRVEAIAAQLSGLATRFARRGAGRVPGRGSDADQTTTRPDTGTECQTDRNQDRDEPRAQPPGGSGTAPGDQEQAGGIKIAFEDLPGHHQGRWDYDMNQRLLTITLNRLHPFVERHLEEPVQGAALWAVIAGLFAGFAVQHGVDLVSRMMPRLIHTFGDDFLKGEPAEVLRAVHAAILSENAESVREPTKSDLT